MALKISAIERMQTQRIFNWAEKRIKRRHKAPGLRCTLAFDGIVGWLKPNYSLQCIDINRYGMAASITVPIKEGSMVSLNFRGKYIIQSNVKALVSSCSEFEDEYRVSLVFCYATDSKHYSRRIDNALSRIERIYSQQ